MSTIASTIKTEINNRGIKMIKVSEETKIGYQRLNRIFNQHTPMLATEFLSLCAFLEIDPNIFKKIA